MQNSSPTERFILSLWSEEQRASDLTPSSKGRGGRKEAEYLPAATSGRQEATHPRGIITSDLHSLKIRHSLVGGRRRNVLIDEGQFGGRCFSLWNGQTNSLPSEEAPFSEFEIEKEKDFTLSSLGVS